MAKSGDIIRACRIGAKLSQQVLAERSGTHQATIARYETHQREPSVSTFANLLRCCGCQMVVKKEDKEWEINL